MAAAGNESQRELRSDFEVSVSPPAVCDGIVSVAALERVNGKLTVAKFSNTGAIVSGPGVDVLSAAKEGGLMTMSGTSMATPHVAGVAALWAQKSRADRVQTPGQLASNLRARATLEPLSHGFSPGDVGAGLVMAP